MNVSLHYVRNLEIAPNLMAFDANKLRFTSVYILTTLIRPN